MGLSSSELFWGIAIAVLLAGALAYLFWKQRKEAGMAVNRGPASSVNTKQLQLQAYERLILLADRIALPNLISRLNQPGLSSRDMQALLAQTIRQEFEHNITQQIYVSADAWEAVRNFKEQNLMIIHQVGNIIPPEASGQDLNRALLELLVQNPKASLQQVVADALSFEARKILG